MSGFSRAPYPFEAGELVELVGGFTDGVRGVIVRNEPRTDAEHRAAVAACGIDPTVIVGGTGAQPYRYVVRVLAADGAVADPIVDLYGIHPVNMVHAEPCPYCGRGPCSGSARTALGADVERWADVHPRERFTS